MEKSFFALAIVASSLVYAGCAQNDTSHPDTGGAVPLNQRTIADSTNNGARSNADTSNTNNTNNANMNNDGSNNNGQVNTADSNLNKQQKRQ